MKFNFIGDGIDAVIVDDFYTKDQLDEIMIELKWLTKNSIMINEDKLGSAISDGKILTSKNGVFLDYVFLNWRHSALITHGFTQTSGDDFRAKLLNYNSLFKSLFHCNGRSHLLSYYENADYYKAHKDNTFFTILNYFFIEPKQFTGGEIVLYSSTNDKKIEIEMKHNRTVIIAGSTPHEVTPIHSNLDGKLTGLGRYCNAIFLKVCEPSEINDR